MNRIESDRSVDGPAEAKQPPLARYASDPHRAKSAMMREIALVALVQGYTQESLSKALDAQPGGVMRHFESAKPRQGTIDAYAKLLKISEQHIRLVQGKPLSEDEERDAAKLIQKKLRSVEHEFKPGTIDAATKAIAELSAHRRAGLARQVLLAHHRWELGLPPEDTEDVGPAFDYMVRRIAKLLKPDFDIFSRVRQLEPRETFFSDLYRLLTVNHNLSKGDAEWFLSTARLYFGVHAINYERMDRYLKEKLSHRRSGRLPVKLQRSARAKTRKGSAD